MRENGVVEVEEQAVERDLAERRDRLHRGSMRAMIAFRYRPSGNAAGTG